MKTDFITHSRGAGNPIKDDSKTFLWICNHGSVKGPSKASEMPWDDEECFVEAYRAARDHDPGAEDARIAETFNVIGHLYMIDVGSAREIISRIIKGENHEVVCNDVLDKLEKKAVKDPAVALRLLGVLTGGVK